MDDTPARSLRLALVLAGGAVVVWSAVRVVRLLAGFDLVDGDPHGYAAIFSLVLVPFLVAAGVWLVRDAMGPGPVRVGTGVLLMVSSPVAGSCAVVGFVVGGVIVAVNLGGRRY